MFRHSPILLSTDFTFHSFYAMKYALALARSYHARLHIVHVIDAAPMLPWACPSHWMWWDSFHEKEDCMCAKAATRLQYYMQVLGKEGVEVDYRVVRGKPATEIVRLAEELECELVVVGTHGRTGVEHTLMGSVAEEVARHSPAPVLTIKHPEHEFIEFWDGSVHLRRVLFPTDFSAYAQAVLPYAVSLCREFGAKLVFMHVEEPPSYSSEFLPEVALALPSQLERESREKMQRIAEDYPDLEVEVISRTGPVVQRILEVVKDLEVDLVVQPTHGRSGVARILFGGVAGRVLRRAACPVLTVRPEMPAVRQTKDMEEAHMADHQTDEVGTAVK